MQDIQLSRIVFVLLWSSHSNCMSLSLLLDIDIGFIILFFESVILNVILISVGIGMFLI